MKMRNSSEAKATYVLKNHWIKERDPGRSEQPLVHQSVATTVY